MSKIGKLLEDDNVPKSQLELAINSEEVDWRLIKKIIAASLAIFVSLLVLYASAYGQPSYLYYRSLILSTILILAFLLYPMFKKNKNSTLKRITSTFDLLFILLIVGIQAYIIIDFEQLVLRQGSPNEMDVILGTIYVLLLLEATRRTVGWLLVILGGFFIGQLLISDKMPWIFYGPPMDLSRIIDFIWIRDEGIYSVPIMSVISYVIPFLIFAAFLIRSGAGKFFIEFAVSLTGKSVGGPAKAAIVSSGLMGSISGSAIANVAGTGTFTIPMMHKAGYKRDFAGSVEAVASTGGQIMPPVMGAAAFILAQNLQIPYGELILYALIPAVLYYLALYFSVHLEAKRLGLRPLTKEEIPNVWKILFERGYLLIPLIIILVTLFMGFSPIRASIFAIISLVPLTMIRKSTRLSPIQFLSSLEDAVRSLIPIAIACGTAGLIIAGVNISGIGLKFSYLITTISQEQLWLTLILVMIAAVILGFGLPTTAVYVTVAVVLAPALIELGLSPLQAHMFAFFYGVIAAITPPIALASFAAASISNTPPMKTSFLAFRIGLAGFIIPFMFAYGPELLLQGSIDQIILSFITASLGLYLLASSIIGYYVNSKANYLIRVMLFGVSILMLTPEIYTDLIGLGAAILIYFANKKLTPVTEINAKINEVR